jgi:hypothetical protein
VTPSISAAADCRHDSRESRDRNRDFNTKIGHPHGVDCATEETTMHIEVLGAWGEFLGGIASVVAAVGVVGSLIFVGIQI